MKNKHTDKDVVQLFHELKGVMIFTDEIIDNFLKSKGLLKEEFEHGWYGYKDYKRYCLYFDKCKRLLYGINANGDWIDHGPVSWEFSSSSLVKLLDKEVEEALIKEAKKRGFKEGVEYKSTGFDKYNFLGELSFCDVHKDNKRYRFNLYDSKFRGCIYSEGKWAEIVGEKEAERM